MSKLGDGRTRRLQKWITSARRYHPDQFNGRFGALTRSKMDVPGRTSRTCGGQVLSSSSTR